MKEATVVDVSRTFTVRQPREVIVAYLRDFSHAEQWDPGTVECTQEDGACLLYTSPSPRDRQKSRMPSSA